jgi:serine protease inhibitor
MKREMTKLLMLSGTIMLATSCSTVNKSVSSEEASRPQTNKEYENMDAEYLTLTDAQDSIIAKNNTFAVKLFEKTAKMQSTVISPISVSYLMAMLANGANGQTKADIMKALQLEEKDLDEMNALYKMMIQRCRNTGNGTTLNIANYFAMNKEVNLEDAYANKMKNIYNAGIESLDFTSQKTTAHINNWCKKNTNGMIPSIIDKVDANASAYIMNAIFFNGTWADKFSKSQTKNENFRGYTRDITMVPMMHKSEKLLYWGNDIYTAVRIPYSNSSYTMTVMLPNEGVSIDEMLKTMENADLTAWRQDAEQCIVDLKLPRFTTEADVTLNNIISELGAANIFNSNADFTNIAKSNMFVSQMFQKAKIEVSEEGTKAAAVTAAIMTMSALPTEEPKHVTFHANRPFVYMITEANTNAIFFMGQYTGKE